MINNKNNQKFVQHHSSKKSGALQPCTCASLKVEVVKSQSQMTEQTGFSLIELIISLAVFTIGVLGTLNLAFSNVRDSRDNLDKIIAVNLAREGIELIRNVRDSNWLKVEANEKDSLGAYYTWDYGLSVGNQGYVYMDYNEDYNDAFPTVIPGACSDIESCVSSCTECELYPNIDGYYAHDNSGVLINYSRGFKLNKICVDETLTNPQANEDTNIDTDQDCDAGDTHIGFQVTSYVQWTSNGTLKSVQIVDQLYNWRR